jgi:hypothetical protein
LPSELPWRKRCKGIFGAHLRVSGLPFRWKSSFTTTCITMYRMEQWWELMFILYQEYRYGIWLLFVEKTFY